jgi:hypothetical protein
MAEIEITEAVWQKLPEPVQGLDWMLRVVFVGSGLVDRALPLVAMVGDVMVESLSGSLLGNSAQGFLSAVPAVGAKVAIGYPDTGVFATQIEFPGLPDPQIA